jgi:hypothetical protein
MKKVYYEKTIPMESVINDPDFGLSNYEDGIYIELSSLQDYSIDYLTTAFFISLPKWLNSLLKLRNILVKPFGLNTDSPTEIKSIASDKKYELGENAVFFKIIKRNENELVMSEEDKHLNFRTSVLKLDQNDSTTKIYSITIVRYNNTFGKVYFFFVKPFHKLIIRTLLKNMKNNLNKHIS